jgi:hypothetical protein
MASKGIALLCCPVINQGIYLFLNDAKPFLFSLCMWQCDMKLPCHPFQQSYLDADNGSYGIIVKPANTEVVEIDCIYDALVD